MYIKRKIDKFLLDWKNDEERLPLVISGARQVGKTESILHFANENYENVVYINFIENPKFKGIVSDGYATQDIIKKISVADTSLRFIKNKTIIIFDEIQEQPDIATALKFFAIDKGYDVICSGSLLGINYKRIHSLSVGYKTDYEMYSLDFEEFLNANGYGEKYINDIFNHMLNLEKFSDVEYNTYKKMFLDYIVLGGMPKVVESYLSKNDFSDTDKIQMQIVDDYEGDVRKYVEGLSQSKIIKVLRSIPTQLAKVNKKFQFSKISNSARAREYEDAVEWLIDCGIVKKCNIIHNLEFPLKINEEDNNYKIYYHDTGLLLSQYDEYTKEDVRIKKNIDVHRGAIYENIASEMLYKQKIDLYSYRRYDSELELDFIIRHKENIVPIEVKAGKNQSKSLRTVIGDEKYDKIKYGIKFADKNIGFENNIYTFPQWTMFLLKKFLKEKL